MNFFRYDSEFMMGVSKVADYVILNLLCLLFCIPIVTAGASVTATYYVAMKLVRGEEPSVWKSFYKSFKENLKQATVIWILALALMGFLAYDWYLLWDTQQIGNNPVMRVGLAIVTVVVSFAVISVFPFLARFQVSTKAAIRNAVWFGILHIPQMILIILLYAMTIYICIRYMEWLILAWAVGTGLTLYYSSRMFVKQFAKLEPKKEEPDSEGENNTEEG